MPILTIVSHIAINADKLPLPVITYATAKEDKVPKTL